jgi:cytochrome c-type biogenesis protein CcmE
MTARQRRMFLVALIVLGVGGAVALARTAFQENMLYFFSPSDLAEAKAPPDRLFRLGGMVTEGSFKRSEGSMEARFVLTDFKHSVTVSYSGLLPDLFREGQGVVARGRMGTGGVFVAEEVLAKHDENYMPPDVADALRKQHAKPPAGAQPAPTQPVLSSGEGA